MARPSQEQRRRGRPPKGLRADTRGELLDAALKLFARQGYAATTVRQIAEEVGVRDSAIYAHFSAKRELLDALIEESGPQLVERDLSGLTETRPSEVLPEFFERLVSAWDRPRPRQLISLLVREGMLDAPDVLGAVRGQFEAALALWAEKGLLRDDIPTELLLWELTTPLAAIRILYLNAHASPARRREGRRLAGEHVTYFLATAAKR